MINCVAIVPAAGSGRRMGAGRPKQLMDLAGMPVISRSLAACQRAGCVRAVVLVVPPGLEEQMRRACVEPYGLDKVAAIVPGGAERQHSVEAGLAAAESLGAEYVLIHDGVRPFAGPELFEAVLAAAAESGAAIAAIGCTDTIKRDDGAGGVEKTLERERLWQVQTPQGFRLKLLRRALARARETGLVATDEARLLEMLGHKVRLVEGSRRNLKLTTPEDMAMARALMATRTRQGQGYDAHRLVEGRRLVLGGVELPFEKGLLGHSDADVLCHAVMDALLAAAGLGDIGRHFPDSDPAYRGADSLELLRRVVALLAGQGWRPAQIGVTLLAQRPRIAPHIPEMTARLAEAAGLEPGLVNIAATTTEGLGFVGRGEGMAAQALAVISAL